MLVLRRDGLAVTKKLTEIQRRTVDGALIIGGWMPPMREKIIEDLEPVLADMLEMSYEVGQRNGRSER
jgi:hypothetical protein